METNFLQRVNIVGCSGSGKTTLGRDLACCLAIPAVDLDELNWLPSWRERDKAEFEELVQSAVAKENWVISGNYSRVRPVIWSRVQTVIWLDYSLPVVMLRLTQRTFRRVRGESCCNGNRESLRRTFSRDSILLWGLKTHARRHREYPALLSHPDAAHLQILHFQTPRQTRDWLAQIESKAAIC